MTSRPWEVLRDRVLPPPRSALIALAVALAWIFVLSWFPTQGWMPSSGLFPYASLGVVVTLVLLVRDRFPRLTLLTVALFFPDVYGDWMSTHWHVLPIVLAAYMVAARGLMRTPWILLIALGGLARAHFMPGLDPRGWWVFQNIRFGYSFTLWDLDFSRTGVMAAMVTATVLLGRASYQQRRANEELRRRQEELERLRRIETDQMVTAERTRIARELHDVVAHHISAVVLRAQAADRVADSRPEQLREAVRWIALDGQHTLAAMRQVVRVLRSSDSAAALEPQTTLAEIPQIAERMAAVGMPVRLDLPPLSPILPAAVELAAVRIVQESLTNALVHARAGEAAVHLRVVGDELLIEVHDDGGRTVTNINSWARRAVTQPSGIPRVKGSGHGLVGMRERAASCNGTLEIGTSGLGGWLIRARLQTAVEQDLPQAV